MNSLIVTPSSMIIIGGVFFFLKLEDCCRHIQCFMRLNHLILTIPSQFSVIYIAFPSDFINLPEIVPLPRKAHLKANKSSATFPEVRGSREQSHRQGFQC